MVIISYINTVINFIIARFQMIQKIHNITILSADSWINILTHGLIATIELVLIYFLLRFLLSTLNLGTYFVKFFSLIGSFFVARSAAASRNQEFPSASPQEIARINMLVKQILQNSTQNSQSSQRRY